MVLSEISEGFVGGDVFCGVADAQPLAQFSPYMRVRESDADDEVARSAIDRFQRDELQFGVVA